MLIRLRRLLVPIVALSLAVGGLAYAAVDDDSTLDMVQDTAEEAPETVVDDGVVDGVVDDDGPTDIPDDVEEVIPDEGTPDDGIVDEETEDESHGPEWSTEGCPEGFSGNHGQYVSSTDDRPRDEAARSECGKPVHADEGEDAGEEEELQDETARGGREFGEEQASGNSGRRGPPG